MKRLECFYLRCVLGVASIATWLSDAVFSIAAGMVAICWGLGLCLIFYIIAIVGCARHPSPPERQKLPTSFIHAKVRHLEDGEAAWVEAKSLIVDENRYVYINDDDEFGSTPEPTKYRVFRYGDQWDLYIEAKDLKEHKSVIARDRNRVTHSVAITGVIIVDDIDRVQLDIARRLQKQEVIEDRHDSEIALSELLDARN